MQAIYSQCLSLNLDEQDPLDGNGGIGVNNIVIRTKVLNEQRQDRDELVLRELNRQPISR
jgi:hypothetical protein